MRGKLLGLAKKKKTFSMAIGTQLLELNAMDHSRMGVGERQDAVPQA